MNKFFGRGYEVINSREIRNLKYKGSKFPFFQGTSLFYSSQSQKFCEEPP